MTKKELEEIRDKLSDKFFASPAGFNYPDGDDCFKEGFHSCAEILLSIIKDYEEALESLNSYDEIDAYNNDDSGYIAVFHENPKALIREVLKKHRGSE